MERLATLTPADIKNGTLNHMLASAGIPNVQEYVKQFHRQTEELVIEELEHPHSDAVITDEQIVPPADIQSWLTGLRPRFDDPVTEHQPVVNPQQLPPPPPPVPKDLSGLLTGLHPGHDHTIDEPVFEQVTQPQPRPPVNISGWLKRLAPINLGLAEKDFTSDPIPDIQNYTTVSGDLGSWLNDWSRSFALQPPPTSLDTWLKGLIPQDIHEPLGKAASPKARLNSYLNAAQEVLSQHGYNVDSGTLPANVQAPVKAGTFGNVKHMYFLWRTLDKNNDRKITVEDVQIMLQEMGLGFLSQYVAKTLFDMVDTDHDGALQFRDFVALMGIIKQLVGAMGSAKA